MTGIQKSAAKITSLMYRRRGHAPAHHYLHSKMWLIPLRTVLVLLPCSSCWCSWHGAHKKLLWCLSWGIYTLRGWVKAEMKFRGVLVNFHCCFLLYLACTIPSLTGKHDSDFSAAVTLVLSSMSLFHCWGGCIKAFSFRQALLDSCR